MSSNVDDHRDPIAFVGEQSDNLPSAVFLDPNGNFSLDPPRPTDLDNAQTETAPKNIFSRKQQAADDDEEIPSQPKRKFKSKNHNIIMSDDERPSSPGVEAPKQKTGKTWKKSDAAQPRVLKPDDTTS
jgi:hypothetical protein